VFTKGTKPQRHIAVNVCVLGVKRERIGKTVQKKTFKNYGGLKILFSGIWMTGILQ